MPFPLESLEQMNGFFWVLIRVSIIIFLLPFFGAKGVPVMWKAGISFVIAVILTPVVSAPMVFPTSIPEIMIGVMGEALFGLILALGIKTLLASVQLAGQFMSFQMGFSMARAMDPQTGTQSTVLTQFLYLFTVLIIFAMDGHHLFIRALAFSFETVPPNSISFGSSIGDVLIKNSSYMFILGLKIASPIIVALFLSNLCLGIVARTVPQINILMIGFPINIIIGLILFGMMLVNIVPLLSGMLKAMGELLFNLIQLM